jgi:hypothetical protein
MAAEDREQRTVGNAIEALSPHRCDDATANANAAHMIPRTIRFKAIK